jgi:phosphoribosylformimino-5-aminoimidazole carboxamide ribotide isomerase
MRVIPAIDIYQGNVVRLRKGDVAHCTVYSKDPLAMAKEWRSQGAQLLHVVDLSAAFSEGDNRAIIKKIAREVDIDVQAGGGIRQAAIAKELIDCGVKRVVIGTKAIDEIFLDTLIEAIGPESIAVGVDASQGSLVIKGWREKTDVEAIEFIGFLQTKGIKWVIYTDIARDGMLSGVDIEQIRALAAFKGIRIIASGGVANIKDIENIRENAPFIWGVITGKALYEGSLRLDQLT